MITTLLKKKKSTTTTNLIWDMQNNIFKPRILAQFPEIDF